MPILAFLGDGPIIGADQANPIGTNAFGMFRKRDRVIGACGAYVDNDRNSGGRHLDGYFRQTHPLSKSQVERFSDMQNDAERRSPTGNMKIDQLFVRRKVNFIVRRKGCNRNVHDSVRQNSHSPRRGALGRHFDFIGGHSNLH